MAIAKAFKEIGWIERYGSGIARIHKICVEHGIKKPLFEEVFNGFRVTLPKDKVTDNLSENQNQIIRLMQQDTFITTNELANKVKISQRKIKESISKLKQMGVIERIGAAKGGYWKLLK